MRLDLDARVCLRQAAGNAFERRNPVRAQPTER